MTIGSVRALFAVLTSLLLAACVSGAPSTPNNWLAERDAARAYIVSDVAEQASEKAIEAIRGRGNAEDRRLIDGYLADPAHSRQLPSRYQDYLVEVFDVDQINAFTDWSGDPAEFVQQYQVHQFVLAQSLTAWHIDHADLALGDVFDDHLVNTLILAIDATPRPLIPTSGSGG